ncbi:hypothetical protein KIPB_010569, partial [Kipferlia bialata]|eukprot:g10569.t1
MYAVYRLVEVVARRSAERESAEQSRLLDPLNDEKREREKEGERERAEREREEYALRREQERERETRGPGEWRREAAPVLAKLCGGTRSGAESAYQRVLVDMTPQENKYLKSKRSLLLRLFVHYSSSDIGTEEGLGVPTATWAHCSRLLRDGKVLCIIGAREAKRAFSFIASVPSKRRSPFLPTHMCMSEWLLWLVNIGYLMGGEVSSTDDETKGLRLLVATLE